MGYIKSQFIAWVAQWIEQKFPNFGRGFDSRSVSQLKACISNDLQAFYCRFQIIFNSLILLALL